MAYEGDPYLASLNQSTADIRRQIERTLTEINRQQAVAGAQVARIPGAANAVYTQGRDSVAGDMASISAKDRNGNQRVKPLASLMDAFTNGAASYGRAAGLFTQGLEEQATQRRGDVDSILQQLLADNTSKANTYIAGRQSEDRNRDFQMGEADRAAALQRELQDRQAALNKELLDLQRSTVPSLLRPPAPKPTSLLRPPSLMDRLL